MRIRIAAILVLFAAAALAAGAHAAEPVAVVHTGPLYDTFADELCGIDGTSSLRFVGNFKLYADGTFLSTGNTRTVFTSSATGRQVETSGAEQVTGAFDRTVNGDGTVTETFVFKGLPVKVKIENGPTLTRDAGSATVAITFVLEPDGSLGDVVSQTVVAEHGPHPSLDDDTVFCAAVTSALA
jgi:hypothetical protein